MQNTSLTRRNFLRLSTGVLCGGLLAGCALFKNNNAPQDTPKTYYQNHREEISKDIQSLFSFIEKTAAGIYGAQTAAALCSATLASFNQMLPDLPYIGGQSNELTSNLYQSAAALALYREMQARGYKAEETGRLIYFGLQSQLAASPMAGIAGPVAFTQFAQDQFKQEAEVSHQRTYPEDWVFDYVAGDGKTFDYGIDYTECGICKYFHAQGADEFIPYLCVLDYPVSQATHSGLTRTTTLGRGGSRCDFRYKSGGQIHMDWTPGYLKNQPGA